MKRLATLVFALLLAGSLSFAHAGGATGGAQKKPAESSDTSKPDTSKKGKKGAKKGHKGGKKSKKGGASTTPPPK